jgi:methyl-accepting chemotaxis protein
MSKKHNKRNWKNLLINNKIQFRIVLINLICMFLVVGINTAVMFSSSICNIYYEGNDGLLKIIDMYTLSSEVLTFSLAAIFILAVISQVLLTHKICGPLVNFTNSFQRIARGDLTRPIKLRSGDLLSQESKQFNAMLSDLSGHIGDLRQDNRILFAILKELSADPADQAKINEALEFIKENEHVITAHLEKLKLPKASVLEN